MKLHQPIFSLGLGWVLILVTGWSPAVQSEPLWQNEDISPSAEFSSQEEVRSTKVMVAPALLLFGVLNAEVNFQIAPSWSLDPRAFYFNAGDSLFSVGFSGVGLYGRYHFGRQAEKNSWYLAFGADAVRVEATLFGISGDSIGVLPGLMGGYQWVGKTVTTRLGLGYSAITPVIDLTMGIQF